MFTRTFSHRPQPDPPSTSPRFAVPVPDFAPQRTQPPPSPAPLSSGRFRLPPVWAPEEQGRAGVRPAVGPDYWGVREHLAQRPNHTGLPDTLKAGIESLSGVSLDNVKVHYNSSQPARLNALAYARGSDIHLAPGQERHLPHEAWHVVQQAQGRVRPTKRMKGGVLVNEDQGLEREADVIVERAADGVGQAAGHNASAAPIIQMQRVGTVPVYQLKKLPLNSIAGAKSVPEKNLVYFGNEDPNKEAPPVEVDSVWEMPPIPGSSRVELLKSIAESAGEVGNKIKGVVVGSIKRDNDKKIVEGGWNTGSPTEENPKGSFDPTRVRISGSYGGRKLALDYHFGLLWNGYVIHVKDAGEGIDAEMKISEGKVNLDPTKHYGNIHKVKEKQESSIAEESVKKEDDPKYDAKYNAEYKVDAVTKLAGEGARWKCISDNLDKLRDTTRIYSNAATRVKLAKEVKFIDFPLLWKSWTTSFGGNFGIEDSDVVQVLEGNTLGIQSKNDMDNKIGTGDCDSMTHDRDICVDREKPASQEELAIQELQLVEVRAEEIPMQAEKEQAEEEPTEEEPEAKLRSALEGQIKKVRGALEAKGIAVKTNGAYRGNRKFVFDCMLRKTDQPEEIPGYESNEQIVAYPVYRGKADYVNKWVEKEVAVNGSGRYYKEGLKIYEMEKNDKLMKEYDDDLANVEDELPYYLPGILKKRNIETNPEEFLDYILKDAQEEKDKKLRNMKLLLQESRTEKEEEAADQYLKEIFEKYVGQAVQGKQGKQGKKNK